MSNATEQPINPLRPNQTADLQDEQVRLKKTLKREGVDKADINKQLRKVNTMISTQSATQLQGQELDSAQKRIDTLRESIQKGMPSHEEMRKAPPGAVGKHIDWEKRNKKNIAEYKRLQIACNTGSDDPELASVEKFRPTKNTLNMHDAVIPGQDFHGIDTAAVTTVLSTEDIKLIRERAPAEISGKLALMDAEGRSIVKAQFVTDYVEPEEPKQPAGKPLSRKK